MERLRGQDHGLPRKQPDRKEWQEYHDWFNGLKPRERYLGRTTGQWPEGTPELFTQLYLKTTPTERNGRTPHNTYPPIAEVLVRTEEDIIATGDRYVQETSDMWDKAAEGIRNFSNFLTGGKSLGPNTIFVRALEVREQQITKRSFLTDVERTIIELRSGMRTDTTSVNEPMSRRNIGRMLGFSKGEVRKIERQAKRKLSKNRID